MSPEPRGEMEGLIMYYKLLSKTTPKARNSYPCIWCRERIAVGEMHVHLVGVYDGLQDDRWHLECYDAGQTYFAESREEEFEPHACKRGTNEQADKWPSPPLAR